VNQWEIMLETAHNHGLVCQKIRTDTSFLTANMSYSALARAKQWKLSTQTCPRMSKVAHGRVLVSQKVQSHIVVIRRVQSFFVVSQRSSWSSWSVVVVGRFSWSVVLRGQSAFFLIVAVSLRGQSFFVDGVYILW